MLDSWRLLVLRLLRLPPEPHVPEGSPESVLVFRAGRNFYRWRVFVWAVAQVGVAASAVFGYFIFWRYIVVAGPPWVRLLLVGIEAAGVLGAAVALPVTFLALRWDYELRWYILTDRSLRIRRGVWSVEELTMTFANIQEIRVTAGPVQGWLGLADVEVRAAGGGTASAEGGPKGHVASLEGVENAAAIRDVIVERLRRYRDAGLGDQPEETGAAAPGAVEAAQRALAEARALRRAVEAGARPSTA